MVKKRSNRKNVQHFYCPHCDRRLWRLGRSKRFMSYLDAAQIQQNLNISRKSAASLATESAGVDPNSWLEEFFCEEDGKLWMKLTMNSGSEVEANLIR